MAAAALHYNECCWITLSGARSRAGNVPSCVTINVKEIAKITEHDFGYKCQTDAIHVAQLAQLVTYHFRFETPALVGQNCILSRQDAILPYMAS